MKEEDKNKEKEMYETHSEKRTRDKNINRCLLWNFEGRQIDENAQLNPLQNIQSARQGLLQAVKLKKRQN